MDWNGEAAFSDSLNVALVLLATAEVGVGEEGCVELPEATWVILENMVEVVVSSLPFKDAVVEVGASVVTIALEVAVSPVVVVV